MFAHRYSIQVYLALFLKIKYANKNSDYYFSPCSSFKATRWACSVTYAEEVASFILANPELARRSLMWNRIINLIWQIFNDRPFYPSQRRVPDWPLYYFITSKSGNQRILCWSRTSCDGFWSSKLWNCRSGSWCKRLFLLWIPSFGFEHTHAHILLLFGCQSQGFRQDKK